MYQVGVGVHIIL